MIVKTLTFLLLFSVIYPLFSQESVPAPPYIYYELDFNDGRQENGYSKKPELIFSGKTAKGKKVDLKIPKPPTWMKPDWLPKWWGSIIWNDKGKHYVFRNNSVTIVIKSIEDFALGEGKSKFKGTDIKAARFRYVLPKKKKKKKGKK